MKKIKGITINELFDKIKVVPSIGSTNKDAPMIVGIFGQMHNGKTTFGSFLVDELNHLMRINNLLGGHQAFAKTAFAKQVKLSVSRKHRWHEEYIEEWKNNNDNVPGCTCNMRTILQREGQSAREIMPDVWIRHLVNQQSIVIDDGRYINEMQWVKKENGFNILIIRPGFDNAVEHPSESEVKRIIDVFKGQGSYKDVGFTTIIDNVVMNSGTLEQLQASAKSMSRAIMCHFENVGLI